MALTRTTLSGALNANDTLLRVASATGFAAGEYIKVDDEFMLTTEVSGTNISVMRGVNGTATVAHAVTAGVVTGTGDEFVGDAVATAATYPLAGRQRRKESFTAAFTVTLDPGIDKTIVLNGTSVIAVTVPIPTVDMDGDELNFVSNGAAAHTITFTGGLSGAGSGYDVVTINATAPSALKVVACNALWVAYSQPPMGGTVTNIIGSIA